MNQFERECTTFGVRESEWTIQLARLLHGAALEVYQRMPDENLDNYRLLKTELLKRFNFSEDGYRDHYRKSAMLINESPEQFVYRLKKYRKLERISWIRAEL